MIFAPKGVAPYGDWDGDGFDDYLVGDFSFSGDVYCGERILLLSGIDGSELLVLEGDLADALAGISVSNAGDWNGDGVDDVAAGAPAEAGFQNTPYSAGAYIFSGADGSILRFFDGEEYCIQNSLFGRSVSSGKDVNGDGALDLIVGAPFEPYNISPHWLGSAFVFSGATGSLLWEHQGTTPGEVLGAQVQLIDDHDGDGLADFMALSPHHDIDLTSSYPEAGRLTVLAGAVGDAYPVCEGGPNSVGDGAVLWNSGPISVGSNALELVVSGVTEASPVVFVHGELGPATPFGGGELCLGAPLAILAVTLSDSDGGPGEPAQARLPVDLQGLPFTAGGNEVEAGDRWAFQALYRDSSRQVPGGWRRNASNALDVVFLP